MDIAVDEAIPKHANSRAPQMSIHDAAQATGGDTYPVARNCLMAFTGCRQTAGVVGMPQGTFRKQRAAQESGAVVVALVVLVTLLATSLARRSRWFDCDGTGSEECCVDVLEVSKMTCDNADKEAALQGQQAGRGVFHPGHALVLSGHSRLPQGFSSAVVCAQRAKADTRVGVDLSPVQAGVVSDFAAPPNAAEELGHQVTNLQREIDELRKQLLQARMKLLDRPARAAAAVADAPKTAKAARRMSESQVPEASNIHARRKSTRIMLLPAKLQEAAATKAEAPKTAPRPALRRRTTFAAPRSMAEARFGMMIR
eukprot:s1692_g6.t1